MTGHTGSLPLEILEKILSYSSNKNMHMASKYLYKRSKDLSKQFLTIIQDKDNVSLDFADPVAQRAMMRLMKTPEGIKIISDIIDNSTDHKKILQLMCSGLCNTDHGFYYIYNKIKRNKELLYAVNKGIGDIIENDNVDLLSKLLKNGAIYITGNNKLSLWGYPGLSSIVENRYPNEFSIIIPEKSVKCLDLTSTAYMTFQNSNIDDFSKQQEIIEFNLQKYPDLIHFRYERRLTLLHQAAASNSLELVKYYITKGANIHLTPIIQEAIFHANLPMLRLFAKLGVNTKYQFFNHTSPIQFNKYDLNNIYLDKDPESNLPEKYKYTPLQYAAQYPNLEIMEFILEMGGDINYRDNEVDPALLIAIHTRQYSLAERLLKEPNIDVKVRSNKSGINYNSLQILAENEPNTDVQNLASYKNVISMLIQKGLDIYKSKNGECRAVEIMIKVNNIEMAKVITGIKGLNLNKRFGYDDETTILELAYKELSDNSGPNYKNFSMFETLVKGGANYYFCKDNKWLGVKEAVKEQKTEIDKKVASIVEQYKERDYKNYIANTTGKREFRDKENRESSTCIIL